MPPEGRKPCEFRKPSFPEISLRLSILLHCRISRMLASKRYLLTHQKNRRVRRKWQRSYATKQAMHSMHCIQRTQGCILRTQGLCTHLPSRLDIHHLLFPVAFQDRYNSLNDKNFWNFHDFFLDCVPGDFNHLIHVLKRRHRLYRILLQIITFWVICIT